MGKARDLPEVVAKDVVEKDGLRLLGIHGCKRRLQPGELPDVELALELWTGDDLRRSNTARVPIEEPALADPRGSESRATRVAMALAQAARFSIGWARGFCNVRTMSSKEI